MDENEYDFRVTLSTGSRGTRQDNILTVYSIYFTIGGFLTRNNHGHRIHVQVSND